MIEWQYVLYDKHVYTSEGGTMAATGSDHAGRKYVCLTNGGVKAEGHPPPVVETKESAAWGGYLRQLLAFTESKRAVFFRAAPRIERAEGGGFYVYSRLSVE